LAATCCQVRATDFQTRTERTAALKAWDFLENEGISLCERRRAANLLIFWTRGRLAAISISGSSQKLEQPAVTHATNLLLTPVQIITALHETAGRDDPDYVHISGEIQAGIKLGRSHSGRRTLAAKVLAAIGDIEVVQAVPGHQELDHTKPYPTVDQSTIRRAFELAL